jgi:transketolase
MNFRQWGSLTPGHPGTAHTPGVETTTGPLGQGLTNAVGMAIAERWLAARFNRPDFPLIDHMSYAIVSDGDLMEGISHEACSLAGHLGLGKLIFLYDDNHITIDGKTELAFHRRRAEALRRLRLAHATRRRPRSAGRWRRHHGGASRDGAAVAHRCRTTIGFGSPNRAGTAKAHGEPLGACPGLPADGQRADATRNSSAARCSTRMAAVGCPNLIGGSRRPGRQQQATWMINRQAFRSRPATTAAPNIHFGVREHGMGAHPQRSWPTTAA